MLFLTKDTHIYMYVFIWLSASGNHDLNINAAKLWICRRHLRWQKMTSPSNWPFKKKSLHLNDNTGFCSIIQASKWVFGSLLAKNNFFVQFWTKNFASSRLANCGSGLPAEWPFRSQNAIEASDSPLPGGLWVKRLITHALCSLAYSDIAWCKLFQILTMKGLYWVFLPTKHHIVYWFISPSISK